MTAYAHIVKGTSIASGNDVVYSFVNLVDARSKLAEFEGNEGMTGSVIYENVRSHGYAVPYEEELYENGDSRYIENLDVDLQQP